ncbi:MAG: hypothetical protein K5985_02005 [Lachnospiraceae bacterium]|nr:hypothetical protein [Lachnospiraceae bacterium]
MKRKEFSLFLVTLLTLALVLPGCGASGVTAEAPGEEDSEEYEAAEWDGEDEDWDEDWEEVEEDGDGEKEEDGDEEDDEDWDEDWEEVDSDENDNDNDEEEDWGDDEDLSAHAKEMSTDENAFATEFDWFLDYISGGKYGFCDMIMDEAQRERLTSQEADGLNGGWKCFITTDPETAKKEGSVDRYLHADIDTDGDDFKITLKWWLVNFPGSDGTKEDETGTPDETFKGSWDSDETVHTASELGNVDITEFYESGEGDECEQYAIGKFQWNSGEVDYIGLMRGTRGW